MKKTNSKLQLKMNTVRVLQGGALAQVHGGNGGPHPQAGPPPRGPTAGCTDIGTACSHPPEHTPGSTNKDNY